MGSADTDQKPERPAHWLNDREFFFKYMTRDTARAVLSNGTLRWSTPGTLNDPYDVQFDLRIDVDFEKVKPVALQKLWNAFYGDAPAPVGNKFGLAIRYVRDQFPKLSREQFDKEFGEAFEEGFRRGQAALPDLRREVRNELAKSKILCLSELPDSIQMWTYYAEEHLGVVVRFRSILELDSPFGAARPVRYLADMPRLLDEDFLSDLISGRITISPEAMIDRMVYTKSQDWGHEREWRICSGAGRYRDAPYEDIPFHPLELSGVLLGCRMSEKDKSEFAALTHRRYPHAEVLVAERDEQKFQLNFQNYGL